MMQEDNQKEKNQEQESWSEHFFAEMKNDENYAREEENEKERTSSYRTYLEQKGQKTKMIPSYGLSILLFLVVCGLGFAAFQNHQKMNAMETALMQMNSAKMTETETQTPASETDVTVKVESVEGNIIQCTDRGGSGCDAGRRADSRECDTGKRTDRGNSGRG